MAVVYLIRRAEFILGKIEPSAVLGGELNRSMQHLASNIGEEDVAYEEISAKKTLL